MDRFGFLLNEFRAGLGLAPLGMDPILDRAAQLHAQDMAQRQVLTHGSGPDNSETVADRIAALGYNWRFAAENVAFGQPDERAVLQAWIGAPGHYENMASAKAVSFGFGGASNEMGPYWVLVLAA